jgi:hypothetical protein
VARPASITPEDRAFVDRLVVWGLAIVLLGQAAAGFTETDIWGHTAIGLDTLDAGHLLRVDPYSFTHDQPWVNHEWLWDVVSAAVYRYSGLAGLLAFRASLIAAVLWMIIGATKRLPMWACGLALVTVGVVCSGLWHGTRPQLASLPLYGLVLLRPSALWLPAIFALWANVHGGWMIGLGALATYTVFHLSKRQLSIFVACALATVVNPYGVHLWAALADAISRGWADVLEWQPIWWAGAGLTALWIWAALTVLVALLARRVDADVWGWGWTIVTLLAAARSRRLLAFAAVTAVLLLLPHWTTALRAEPRWTRPRRMSAAAVLALAASVGMTFVLRTLDCFPAASMWQSPDPDAVRFIRDSRVRGNAVVYFDFGEYALFHLRDQIKVSIDNRRETVYSTAVLEDHQRFYEGKDPEYPDRVHASLVWLPRSMDNVLRGLERRGWVRRFEGPNTAVLLKTPGPLVRGRATPGTPCFPRP